MPPWVAASHGRRENRRGEASSAPLDLVGWLRLNRWNTPSMEWSGSVDLGSIGCGSRAGALREDRWIGIRPVALDTDSGIMII